MRLQIEKAGDDLQVVLDSMVDLFQQHFLFAKRSTQGFVALADLVEHGVEAVHQQFEFIVSMRFGCWLFDCSVTEGKAVPKWSSPPPQRCKAASPHMRTEHGLDGLFAGYHTGGASKQSTMIAPFVGTVVFSK